MSELEKRHGVDAQLGNVQVLDQFDPTLNIFSCLETVSGQLSVGQTHALLHCLVVKLSEVVNLFYVLGLCLALVIKESSLVVRTPLLVLDVAEDVEVLFVERLGEFELLLAVILQVAIDAALPRLVRLILLGSHFHDLLDALLSNGALDLLNTENELE